MIRTPLRPLARILRARETGENPDAIEAENLRLRHEETRDRARFQAQGRLAILSVMFFGAFAVVGAQMGLLAASEAEEPRARATGAAIVAQRADITDRRGRILATNLFTHSLYAQPYQMIDKPRAARELAKIFPELKEEELLADFTGSRKFLWIRKKLSPEQKQAVHDIGDPGLLFGPREMRLYPNGQLAAHVLGGASFGREGVHSAEVIGVAGVEKTFDDFLRDPANDGAPLQLSIDLTVQSAMRQVLYGGMKLMNAKGAAAVLMDVHSGEIISMVSLPDFDPNDRPVVALTGDPADSPLFNRAVQGVYELGSTFKIFTAAQSMELGLSNPSTLIEADAPMRWGRFTIREFENKNYGPKLSVTDIIVKSSNVGTARMAMEIGADRQKDFLRQLGLLDATPVEMVEAAGGKPLYPGNWSEITTITASYGHGIAASPLHLAAAYSSLLNGGTVVKPTLVKRDHVAVGPRVVSKQTSAAARDMLRAVVTSGTASFGRVPGYEVAGKTGTANKPKHTGGYHQDKNVNTFASVFPASDPAYVLIVTMDEASDNSSDRPRRTAGWTAVPVAAEVIRRTAPLLGIRPIIEKVGTPELTLTSGN